MHLSSIYWSLNEYYVHDDVFYFQTLSEKGYLKRMKPSTFNLQHRGTIGKSAGKLKMNDSMSDFIVCRAHDFVLYFRYVFVGVPKVNWSLPIEICANPLVNAEKTWRDVVLFFCWRDLYLPMMYEYNMHLTNMAIPCTWKI